MSQLTPEQAKSKLSKFKDLEFRDNQERTISYIMNSDKKFVIIKGRTGFGKSLCAMTCGVMAGKMNYLVQSKFLQTQLLHDFPETVSIFGRNNYQCQSNIGRTCDECLATKNNPCRSSVGCPYKNAKKEALEAKYRILNFNYFISEVFYAGQFSGYPFTIIDEADSLDKVLSDSITLSFTERALFQLNMTGPGRKTVTSKDGLTLWRQFGYDALGQSKDMCNRLSLEIEGLDNDGGNAEVILQKAKELQYFTHLSERCQLFIDNVDNDWRLEEIPRRGSFQAQLNFKPTWTTPQLADTFLWKHSKRFVLFSATFPPLPVVCKLLGIDIDEVQDQKIHEVPTTFPPENAPVYIWSVADLVKDKMDKETPKIIAAVKKILSWYPNDRGMIYTTSYDLCNKIIEGVKSKRLIAHTSSNRQELINAYINAFNPDDPDNAVLISPSSQRGIDLKGDLCKWIIIVKCPYLSLGDKITKSRVYSGSLGQLFYQSDAMCNIEQAAGRGQRSATDKVDVYILDEQVEKLYTQKPTLWSKGFRDQVSWEPSRL